MMDALGTPQRVLLFGGSSEIGLAIVEELVGQGSGAEVVLVGRPGERRAAAATRLGEGGHAVLQVDFDASDHATFESAVEASFAKGDVDVALIAFGVLGDQERAWNEVDVAINLAEVNYVAAVAVGVLLAQRLRTQGHGAIVVLSSVAGQRPRRSNFVYGSTKAGIDAFYTGLREALRPDGVQVLVVRPGFVRSPMTAGMKGAPLTQTPRQVAGTTVAALRKRRSVAWAPAQLRWVMMGLGRLPAPIFRRLPM